MFRKRVKEGIMDTETKIKLEQISKQVKDNEEKLDRIYRAIKEIYQYIDNDLIDKVKQILNNTRK
jgi:hypothetical protein